MTADPPASTAVTNGSGSARGSRDATSEGERMKALYQQRFGEDIEFRRAMWRELCAGFFDRYVEPDDTVLDVADGSIDVVFASNFFEHIDRPTILAVMAEAHRVLRPGGRFLVLQPNIRFCARDYWMFFDHITPIDDRALVEAFALSEFEVTTVVPRFLPFTTKSRLPRSARIVRAYLAFPPAWRLLGKQSFLLAERR
jgi:SAM-dependent methyltransferase